MGWHVKTRSRSRDYSFVGDEPERWWSPFGVDTAFERPTLLVESGTAGWRLLASGIPSTRQDSHHTPVTYTVVGEESHEKDPTPALRLIAAWLDDGARILSGRDEPWATLQLGPALEKELSADQIERWLAAASTDKDPGEEAHQRVARALARLPKPTVDDDEWPGGWWAAAQNRSARRAFLARTARLVKNQDQGGAYLLNLADHPRQLTSSTARHRAALLLDLSETPDKGPTPLHSSTSAREEKKKPSFSAPPSGDAPSSRAMAARRRPSSHPPGSGGSGNDARSLALEHIQRFVRSTRRGQTVLEAIDALREVGIDVPHNVREAMELLREVSPNAVREAIETLRDIGSENPSSVAELLESLRRSLLASKDRRSSAPPSPPPEDSDEPAATKEGMSVHQGGTPARRILGPARPRALPRHGTRPRPRASRRLRPALRRLHARGARRKGLRRA